MTTINTRVHSVLNAPRGHRFSRPGSSHPAAYRPSLAHPVNVLPESYEQRRERLLRQMGGNPRVAHMLEHGVLPHWMSVARQRQEQAQQEAREAKAARLSKESAPADLPGMLPHAGRGRHRTPRRWWGLPALAISAALLLGQRATETIGQAIAQSTGFPL